MLNLSQTCKAGDLRWSAWLVHCGAQGECERVFEKEVLSFRGSAPSLYRRCIVTEI